MIFTIFKKELKDTLRDRRTLIAMIVVPIFVFPVIMGLMTSVSKSFSEDEKEEVYNVGVYSLQTDNQFLEHLDRTPEALGEKKIIFLKDTTEIRQLIKDDSLQIAMVLPADFDANEDMDASNMVHIYFEGTNLNAKKRANEYLDFISDALLSKRLIQRELSPEIIHPIEKQYVNLSTDKEMIGKLAGGFLPYIFIIFGFIGCMYPAIDLFTGEKERKTLETLLTAPIPRWKLLVGKMGVVVISGMAAATFALLGLFLALEVFQLVEDPRMLSVVRGILSLPFILMLYLLLLPLTIFFAGILIPITVSAKTFKEAQSIITPINFVVILPALVGLIPTIELNIYTALIPIVNIVLSTKELVAGTLNPVLMLLSFGVMVLLAVISVMISYKRFGKESNVIS